MKPFKNTGSCILVLPGGRELAPGKTIKLDADAVKNSAVTQWLKKGVLKAL